MRDARVLSSSVSNELTVDYGTLIVVEQLLSGRSGTCAHALRPDNAVKHHLLTGVRCRAHTMNLSRERTRAPIKDNCKPHIKLAVNVF